MKKWRILAIAAAVAAMTAADTHAQQSFNPLAPAPVQPPAIRYPVCPQMGPWLICVQTFKGDQAQMLAEEMVEVLSRNYKLTACIYDRGRKERAEEQERIREAREKFDETVRQLQQQSQDVQPSRRPFRYSTFNSTPEEFAVLVSIPARLFTDLGKDTEKDMEVAHKFLLDLRKMPPPPNKFASPVNFIKEDPVGKKADLVQGGFVNPFTTAIVVHNPTIPIQKQQADPEKADEFLKKLNEGEELSVLRCAKPWTLVVKVYQGQTVMQAPASPSVMTSIGRGLGLIKEEPVILNAQTAQSRATADLLRKMRFESYVMHQSTYSIVTVGQYDSPTDPNLLAIQRSLCGLQLKDARGVVLDTLSAQPLPMKIPR